MTMSEKTILNPITNKCDILFLFDVVDGNPNGDPDAGNRPRQHRVDGDMRGFVTGECIKRKIRDYVLRKVEAGELPADKYDIYIRPGKPLDFKCQEMAKSIGIEKLDKKGQKEISGKEKDKELHDAMCARYFDVRTFGAVNTLFSDTAYSAAIRGPVQVTFCDSVHDIEPERLTLTRCVATKDNEDEKNRTMGDHWIVPYGLYKGVIRVSAEVAKKTGFSADDMSLLNEALEWMFEEDQSAARGLMTMRKLVVFEHSTARGKAHLSSLMDTVDVKLCNGMDAPSRYEDYEVGVRGELLPPNVKMHVVV